MELPVDASCNNLSKLGNLKPLQHDACSVQEPVEGFGGAWSVRALSGKTRKLSKVIPVIQQRPQLSPRRFCYRSCRNRHCPKCQALARAAWVRQRRSELLDCPYFHLVFTLPQPIAALALQNPRVVYTLLFRAASRTLRTLASDPKHLGAEIGFFAVLHTWGQALQLHPHLHCVVPGGGIAPHADRWIPCRPGFFLPVRVLSRLFRRLFLELLEQAFRSGRLQLRHALSALNHPDAFHRYLQPLRQAPLRRTPTGPRLPRPIHPPRRHLQPPPPRCRARPGPLRWRDYRHHRRLKTMTLSAEEFIRRFLLHVLPNDFHRIRHFGFLACRHRRQKLALCRRLLDMPPIELSAPSEPASDYHDLFEQLTGASLLQCPACQRGRLFLVGRFEPGQPPPPEDSS